MSPYIYDERGRRVLAPTKGELRERAILDEAEKQLREAGPDAMTVESIANAAGINRATLYFYFRSKNDVLAALIQRVVNELTSGVATSDRATGSAGAVAITEAIRRTALLWRTHGAVLRAAADLTPSVETVADLWNQARTEIEHSSLAIVSSETANDDELEHRLPAVIRALVAMTEREFYTTFARDEDPHQSVDALSLIWTRALGLT
ncbi:TetR/AcrR family transcriptional regulator [Microbacterium sp. JB110]|uniref:TetR/AcrR family transcriptional regulator n=1 Tax=Microbacterium sp. JB110 TaxID=2024477 RepID=UPI0014822FE3|nr:TetR/AcrR family transcriptional regulator [Microbacterium sp. JB110]